MFGGNARTTHHDSDRFRQIADPFSHSSRFWVLFTQWVCSLAATPLDSRLRRHQTGGNCIIRAATRRRYAASQLLMLQIHHHSQPEVRHIAYKTWYSTGWREKTRPTPPLQQHFREKVRPALHKTPIMGHFSCAGRTLSRSYPPSDQAGRTFSRTRRDNAEALKPTTPLLTPNKEPLKPASPLQPKNAPKTPVSHLQRRWRFQTHANTHEQRRHGFQTTEPPGRQGLAAAPVGGGGAWPGFEIDHSEPQARVWRSRGRAAAHGRTKQPGPSTHTKTPTRHRVGVSEPPVGIEPTTYSLRVNRSAD